MASIQLSNVHLEYPIIGLDRSFKSRVIKTATGGLIHGKANHFSVSALRDVNISIGNGDRIGLVGHNGAGKTTFLKLLAQIYQPTSGVVEVDGKVISTINISLGMEPEATGLENIIIRGLLFGMTKAEINEKLDEICQFTELGDFINLPVRTYSSGMLTRLAFATVTSMDADILLMDEVIGTGDASFIEKAERRLSAFMNRSKILVLASHDESTIRKFCNKALLLKHGEVLMFDDVDNVFAQYHQAF